MKGTKCPYWESPIPMFHVFFKGKNLSKLFHVIYILISLLKATIVRQKEFDELVPHKQSWPAHTYAST